MSATEKYLKKQKVAVTLKRTTFAQFKKLSKLFTSTPMKWEYVTLGRKAA